jgi:hypothetical protein
MPKEKQWNCNKLLTKGLCWLLLYNFGRKCKFLAMTNLKSSFILKVMQSRMARRFFKDKFNGRA